MFKKSVCNLPKERLMSFRYDVVVVPMRRFVLLSLALAMVAIATFASAASAAPRGKAGKEIGVEDFGIQQVTTINKRIAQGWQDYGYQSSSPAAEGKWLRRVYLDVIGRIPTVEELDAFVKDRSPRKKLDVVNRLLGEDYIEDYAYHWTTIWTNILIGRTGGTDDDDPTSRDGMMQYLRRCLQRNKPYDQMVFELITATGTTAPGTESFNGATNFLVGKYEEKAAQATAKTSQIFLGLQVQCTQCHNHPFNEWKQNQFWEMNAFFRQSRPLRRYDGRDIAYVELVDESFAGESGNPQRAELYYELRNAELRAAFPVFVDGTSLVDLHGEERGLSGYLEDINRREELAKLVAKSDYLPRAIVNRYWAHFLGYGFTKPIDDMGPHNPPTHPELLDELAQAIREHSFNLKDLVRWITLSRPYALSAELNGSNANDDPSLGEKPMFSHFYLRQMEAEQLYNSLLVATEAHKTGGSYREQEAIRRKWLSQFTTAFGTDEQDEATTFNGTIPQTLMMMNGELIRKATSAEKGSFLSRIAYSDMENPEKIRYLYQAALARQPDNDELQLANKFLVVRDGKTVEALQDVWWVLLNSNEFILIH